LWPSGPTSARAGSSLAGAATEVTTAGDVFQKHLELKREYNLKPRSSSLRPWAAKDFHTIASRAGEPSEGRKGPRLGRGRYQHPFQERHALHLRGWRACKTRRGAIYSDEAHAEEQGQGRLCGRFSLRRDRVNWDFSFLTGAEAPKVEFDPEMSPKQREIAERRKAFEEQAQDEGSVEEEIAEWNDAYGS
jgi:hypothetical protein